MGGCGTLSGDAGHKGRDFVAALYLSEKDPFEGVEG
jgi:hypothetical protein